MKSLELQVTLANSRPENISPSEQLAKRQAVAWAKIDVARRQKEVGDELEEAKAEIARKETEKAEAEK